MITTEQEFLEREIALWGFDEVFAAIEDGAIIASNGDKGFRWALTTARGSATLLAVPQKGQ